MKPFLPIANLFTPATRYFFFTGKGGVGKTSIACATALELARSGKHVLLVSTDPASNLDEVLETSLGSIPSPVAGAPRLSAMNINPVDADSGRTGPEVYHAAVARELEEELELPAGRSQRIIGLLNDDSNPVGRVHLGVVHLIDLDSDAVSSREDALLDLGFSPLHALNGEHFERLETWSAFCVRHLADAGR
jgi:8-oxo-dGTP pyrophosphatase MutT (NUDIX family)